MAENLHTCDGCCKPRRDIRSCGRDANGDADAPDLCFICRKEGARGRIYSVKLGRYVWPAHYYSYEVSL